MIETLLWLMRGQNSQQPLSPSESSTTYNAFFKLQFFVSLLGFWQEPKLSDDGLTEFQFPVSANVANADVSGIAKALVGIINCPIKNVHESKANIGCAFWVQLDDFVVPEGYFIRISDQGAVFKFADVKSAQEGLDHLKRVIVKRDSKSFLPKGILTNIKTIQ